jgi:hypothetical protein
VLRVVGGVAAAVGLVGAVLWLVLMPPESRAGSAAVYGLFFAALFVVATLVVHRFLPSYRQTTAPGWLGSACLGLAAAVAGTGVLAGVNSNLPGDQRSAESASIAPATGWTASAEPALSPPIATAATTATSSGAAPQTRYACPYGDVCLYPGEDYQHATPTDTWFRYGVYDLEGVRGRHRLFNNQWDGAYVIAYTGYGATGRCFGFRAPGISNWDWGPINSIRLSKTLPDGCTRSNEQTP